MARIDAEDGMRRDRRQLAPYVGRAGVDERRFTGPRVRLVLAKAEGVLTTSDAARSEQRGCAREQDAETRSLAKIHGTTGQI
jgi:hypothetical protein